MALNLRLKSPETPKEAFQLPGVSWQEMCYFGQCMSINVDRRIFQFLVQQAADIIVMGMRKPKWKIYDFSINSSVLPHPG